MKLSIRKSWPVMLAALGAPIAAQDLRPERVLEDDAVEVVSSPVSEAFRDLAVQPTYPSVMQWNASSARALLTFAEGIGSEGLKPADYRLTQLRSAIDAGEGAQLDEQASQTFTWLVEDLRDGRTPMAARRQWFVVDPDADLLPTGRLMQDALTSGDIAGTLSSLNPTHPDYAALRDALASAGNDARRKNAIRANMDRWRWLARDLGGQYLITNVPEYQLRLTVNDQIIRTYRTVVGKPGALPRRSWRKRCPAWCSIRPGPCRSRS